ncbi:MBL fold metallo-hydrolase [Streptomyces sp. Caat 7-52]|uniref:MBL fold metallo-hydrolase n=1 Tax=Streptomyces sp. Caat 7-52 TaxID=2949637 RepID=UPI002036539D|nr:MBL fold metallo-hydrolase [Streptomyces sp. Caat 7-52]
MIDPGMVANRRLILLPLQAAGGSPEQVTDVVFSRHHPDHTLSAALFPAVALPRRHGHTQRRRPGRPRRRPVRISEHIHLLRTPHTRQRGLQHRRRHRRKPVVLTRLWWNAENSADDPFATDRSLLAGFRTTRSWS